VSSDKPRPAIDIHCPMCRKTLRDVPRDYPHRPFCSERCKLVDLDNWLSESYRITEPVELDEDLN